MSSRTSKHINIGNNFKLVVVGDSGVGKSCFLSRYSKSTYNETYNTTIGVDYDVCDVKMPDDTKVRLQIWDTAGQERFRAITMAFYRQSQGVFLVYDCCDMSSLENVKNHWLPSIRKYSNKDAKIVLIGNKVDGIEVARQKGIDTEAIRAAAKAFADQEGIRLIETSAKHNSKVDLAFFSIANELQAQERENQTHKKNKTVSISIDYPDRPPSIFARLCKLLKPRPRQRRRKIVAKRGTFRTARRR